MKRMQQYAMMVGALVALLVSSSAQAISLVIVDPVDPRTDPLLYRSSAFGDYSSGSDYYGYTTGRGPYTLTDGSGLNGANVNIYPTGTPVPDSWATVSNSAVVDGQNTMYLNDGPPSAHFPLPGYTAPAVQTTGIDLYFDLGQQYNVTGFHLWNYNEVGTTDRGMASADIYVSNDDSTWTSMGLYTFTEADGTDNYTGEEETLSGTFQYVLFANTTGFPDADLSPGLSEIRFEAIVPEPGTVMLFGLGGAVIWLWRRSR